MEQMKSTPEQEAVCCCHKKKERDEKEYKDLMNRLSRIEGQVRGIKRMVEEDAYCPEILIQVSAVNAALNSFNKVLLAEHIRSCVAEDIRKGKEDAIKSLISVKLDENNSITHDVTGKYTGASVLLKKSPEGTGIIAGGPARSVCELAGITNIRTKSLGSNNKQNVVLATIEALSQLRSPEEVARLRGKSVEEILG